MTAEARRPADDRSGSFVLFLSPQIWILTISAALLGLLWLLSRFPTVVDLYTDVFFPVVVGLLTSLSGLMPFSIAEVGIGLLCSWLLLAAARIALNLVRRRSLGRLPARAFLRSVTLVVTAVLLGYALWGLNYARSDLITRLSWEAYLKADAGSDTAGELKELAREAVELANRYYLEANGSPDLGTPSRPQASVSDLDAAIDAGYAATTRALRLESTTGAAHGRAKPVAASLLLSYLGISGFYFPWTGEANYNRLIPFSQRIHAIAHEKAHQRGITSEDEASFLGFLAATFSPDPYARYSGYLFAQGQLLRQLLRLDRAAAAELAERRLTGVQRDVRFIYDYWAQFQGLGTRVSDSVNDSYLRLHRVEGGIDSYNRSARLLVVFARVNGGTLAPGAKGEVRGAKFQVSAQGE